MCEQLDEIKAILRETNKNLEQVSEKQKETAELSKRNQVAFDKYREEKQAEFDKYRAETAEISRKNKAEFDKLKKETESEFRRIGHFWGEDTEATFEDATREGIVVCGKAFMQNTTNYIIYNEKKQEAAEIDILLTNGRYILLVEVKHNLPKNTAKERGNIEKLEADFEKKIREMQKYDAAFLKDKKILKAFATRNLSQKYHNLYLEKGYLLFLMQNNKPKVIGRF